MIYIWFRNIICKGFCSTYLHNISDLSFSILQNSFKYPWKCEHIIYLVRIIRSSCTNYTSSCFLSEFWHDFWSWISHSKNNRIFSHRTDHIFSEYPRCRNSKKYISSSNCILESTCLVFEIRKFEKFLFRYIEIFSSTMNYPFTITSDKVFYSVKGKKFCNCYTCCSSPVKYHPYILFLFSCDFQGVYECCEGHDRCSMLIIVHNRNIQFCLESFFDFETSRC